QAHAGAAPDLADAGRAAVEDDLAEEAEQDLSRAPAGGPTDADQGQCEQQRDAADVAQTVDVILQRMTRAMLAGGAHGGEAVRGRRAQPADEEGREEKR